VDIYRETYDQTEIDGLIAFYETPVGQSLIQKQPVVAQKMAMVMVPYYQQAMPKIMDAALQTVKDAMALAPSSATGHGAAKGRPAASDAPAQ
jgi:hypothetical protein